MKPKTVKIMVSIGLLIAAVVLYIRFSGSGADLRAAAAEERINQERVRNELPPPNESAPRGAGPQPTPR